MASEGWMQRGLRWAAAHPVAVLGALCLLQVVPTLWSRDYWAYDEVRHAAVLRELREDGDILSLHLNGVPYPDKPPVYFWLVAGIATVLQTDGSPAFFLASGLGGFLFLLATWGLARATVAARAPRIALLAPLLILVTPLFQVLLRTTRMDLLFGALITASITCLWKGLGPEGARRFAVLGFALGGTATLVKGPAGLALPIAGAVAYLIWTGRARRLLSGDVLLGLVLAAAQIGGWMVGVGVTEGWTYLSDLLRGQVLDRAVLDHKHARPFFHYALVLPIAFLPWTALIVATPWRTLLRRRTWQALFDRRRAPSDQGTWWLGAAFAGGFLLLSLATSKLTIYLLPLLAPLGVLAAMHLLRVRAARGRQVWTAVGITLVVCAALAAIVPEALVQVLGADAPPAAGTGLLAASLALTGLLVLALRGRETAWPLAVTGAGLLTVYLVLAAVVAPSLDPIMSPRRQAQVIADYVDRGYRPLVFRVYPGTYSYYARQNLPETRDRSRFREHVEHRGPILVVMARKYWIAHADQLPGFRRVHEQLIEGRPFVVAVRAEVAVKERE